MNITKNIIISLLLSVLVFSLMTVEKGLKGQGLFQAIGYTLIYSIPIFILEICADKFLSALSVKITVSNMFAFLPKLFGISVVSALITTFLWDAISIAGLYRPEYLNVGDNWDGVQFVFGVPLALLSFFILDFVILAIIIFLKKIKPLKIVVAIILIPSFIFLAYGAWALARCHGQRCLDYLVERAQKENNPSLCQLLDYGRNTDNLYDMLLGTETMSANGCYAKLAIKMAKPSLCELTIYKEICYEEVMNTPKTR